MIIQTDRQCWKCGSWYRKKYGLKLFCNKCGFPDFRLIKENEKRPKWEDRIKVQAAKYEAPPEEEKKEIKPDAIQTELQF